MILRICQSGLWDGLQNRLHWFNSSYPLQFSGGNMQVTRKMLDAGYEEVLKVAKQKKLMWALKQFPKNFIDTILTEGFLKMYEASDQFKASPK